MILSVAGALRPCGNRAAFSVAEDGGTNFAAAVRIARWQVGGRVVLDFKKNNVKVRAASIKGGARQEDDSTSSRTSFVLLAPADVNPALRSKTDRAPPGAFTFRADGVPSQPTLLCELSDEFEPYSPSPPPPPPHCGASLIWRNDRNWGGGFASTVHVGSPGVPPGFVVRAWFNGRSDIELLAAEGATQLGKADGGVLLLAPTASGRDISLRFRGGQGTPQLSCVPAPAAPPPPPSLCVLEPKYEGSEAIKEGKRYQATVTVGNWRTGVVVAVDLGPGANVISSSASASLLTEAPDDAEAVGTGSTVARVRLVGRPSGGGKGSFKVLYAATQAVSTPPFISCEYIAPPAAPSPPPYPPWPEAAPLSQCGLGVAYIVTKSFRSSYAVDLGMRGWMSGALVTLDFGSAEAPSAVDVSECYGCDVVPASEPGLLRLRLTGFAGLHSHNGGVGYKVAAPDGSPELKPPAKPTITCDAKMPPPPSPPPPP